MPTLVERLFEGALNPDNVTKFSEHGQLSINVTPALDGWTKVSIGETIEYNGAPKYMGCYSLPPAQDGNAEALAQKIVQELFNYQPHIHVLLASKPVHIAPNPTCIGFRDGEYSLLSHKEEPLFKIAA